MAPFTMPSGEAAEYRSRRIDGEGRGCSFRPGRRLRGALGEGRIGGASPTKGFSDHGLLGEAFPNPRVGLIKVSRSRFSQYGGLVSGHERCGSSLTHHGGEIADPIFPVGTGPISRASDRQVRKMVRIQWLYIGANSRVKGHIESVEVQDTLDTKITRFPKAL